MSQQLCCPGTGKVKVRSHLPAQYFEHGVDCMLRLTSSRAQLKFTGEKFQMRIDLSG